MLLLRRHYNIRIYHVKNLTIQKPLPSRGSLCRCHQSSVSCLQNKPGHSLYITVNTAEFSKANVCRRKGSHTVSRFLCNGATACSVCSRACLDQLPITIRSLITLCDHIRSKTRLMAIMNLIATLGIIYTSLHDGGLSEYQLSLPCTQDMGRRGRWGVASQMQQQHTLHLCSVLCWPRLVVIALYYKVANLWGFGNT